MPTREQMNELGGRITKELIDQGKLVEAGFAMFRLFVIAKDAPDVQVREMRLAFMAGAEHVFTSIMGMLDPGAEPTDTDLERMDKIHTELQFWRSVLTAKAYPTKGSA